MFSRFKIYFILSIVVLGAVISLSSFYIQKPEKCTAETLGKMLFFDTLLSKNNTVSCASCHKPDFAFSDTVAFSIGDNGKPGRRNAPSVMNLSDRQLFFYDGRAQSLEAQMTHPLSDSLEMNLNPDELIVRLTKHPKYLSQFKEVYNQLPTITNVAMAIAAYEKTLETFHSPWDKYAKGDTNAITQSALRGRNVFNTKGKCFDCHSGPDFTNDEFRNIGLYNARQFTDKGRYDATKQPNDIGKFKVPGLRNVAVTAPYMHNGMFKNLSAVIAYYNNPSFFVSGSVGTDSLLLSPLNLSDTEMTDLEAFLNSLTDEQFIKKTSK